jgi:hypothetical protein
LISMACPARAAKMVYSKDLGSSLGSSIQTQQVRNYKVS